MKLIQAIEESAYHAAYLELPAYRYVVVQYPNPKYIGPKYGTEIHRYNVDGILDYAIVNFNPINWNLLRNKLGEYQDSTFWKPYDEPISRQQVENIQFRENRQTKRIKINPKFKDRFR